MAAAEKISITMTPDMLRVIRDSIDAGEYASTSELLGDAMRVWHQQRTEDAARLDAIRARIRRSLDDPRPDLTEDEANAYLDAVFSESRDANSDAAP